jgi:hypothetical protein
VHEDEPHQWRGYGGKDKEDLINQPRVAMSLSLHTRWNDPKWHERFKYFVRKGHQRSSFKMRMVSRHTLIVRMSSLA